MSTLSGFPNRGVSKPFRSLYGPKYTIQPNIGGWTIKSATKVGVTLGAFGGAAAVFAVFFLSDIPKIRTDIMQKIPVLGDHYVRSIHPADNPF